MFFILIMMFLCHLVNIAKWNIYSVALQDLTFFTFSYLKVNFNYQDIRSS